LDADGAAEVRGGLDVGGGDIGDFFDRIDDEADEFDLIFDALDLDDDDAGV